ncbi:hypothetical protein [Sphingobacterium hotanense]|uniref:Uncharacterized protein n=1 Tax=Sphingobacterium hotanense TaxID=649196 RepID=A0ABT7NQH2_9SPHI|nr:hypothetical protein [Sphingobacterium hotanense]MDM1049415.1 hypothetical protein [Sphingobacterium hotanense]
MNKTIITVNIDGEPQKVELLFGMWTLFRLRDFGFNLQDFDTLKGDPLRFMEMVILLMYLGACNANGKDLGSFDKDVFYDYAEQTGGLSFVNNEEVKKVITCFTNSLALISPKDEKKSKATDKK